VPASAELWGEDVFAQVCQLLCSVIQNHPASLKGLHQAGITRSFLKSLHRVTLAQFSASSQCSSLLFRRFQDMLKSGEVIRAIPETIRSLCLNAAGLDAVKKVSFVPAELRLLLLLLNLL
jgi:hypothetical protein